MTKLARIVILGRPNVGKSTLFNRICGRRRALVGNEPGMTRDRLYATAEWRGKLFEVVDTGGAIPAEKDLLVQEILKQTKIAVEEAAHLVLVLDGRAGVVPLDEELAQLLRRSGKPLSLAVNKIDTLGHSLLTADFHRLGVPDVFPISAEHGLGVDDLLDHVTTRVGDSGQLGASPSGRAPIQVAIIGHPNVGKSTLLNRLLKEERAIVAPMPGTTRDAVDAELEFNGFHFRLVDTAGIRRKGKTKLLAEKLSVLQARKHLERADVALLILDAAEGVTAVDTHIGGYAHESGRSVVIVVNKWDAVSKRKATREEWSRTIRRRMKYLDYAPIVFISALEGRHLEKLLSTIVQVVEARRRRVSQEELDEFLREADLERVPSPRGKPFRLIRLTQAGVAPPTFLAFTNQPGKVHFSLERFLENRLREKFGFFGTPIVIKARHKR